MSQQKRKTQKGPNKGPQRIQQRETQQKEPMKEVPKKVRMIAWIIMGVIVLGVVGVLLWMELRPKPKEPELPERYENMANISTAIYEVILGDKFSDELNEDDLEVWNEIKDDLEYNVYVFIYNQDYEVSEESENLESLVKELYNKEGKNFTILVLNYLKNEGITELLSEYNVSLPVSPVLVHIEGDKVALGGVAKTYLTILSKLTNLKGAQ